MQKYTRYEVDFSPMGKGLLPVEFYRASEADAEIVRLKSALRWAIEKSAQLPQVFTESDGQLQTNITVPTEFAEAIAEATKLATKK